MIKAYKGVDNNIVANSGRGHYKYKVNKWYEEKEAKDGHCGYHASLYPLTCLHYGTRFFVVACDGEFSELGDYTLACTKIKFVKEISRFELIDRAVVFILENPKVENLNHISTEKADDVTDFAIVRGKNPIAKGKKGSLIWLLKEDSSNDIIEMNRFIIGKDGILENTYYDVAGNIVT